MTGPFDALGHVPPAAAYTMVAVVVLAESVLLVGIFVPTLTLLLTAGALARTEQLNLLLVIAAATCAVVAGDFLAHYTGGRLGDRLRTGRLSSRIPTAAWQRAEVLMARRGGQAVLFSRFIPVVRTLTPHLAGAARLPYHRIAPYSAVAASVWVTAEVGTGYAAATSARRVLTYGGPVLAAIVTTAAVSALAWAKMCRRNRLPASGVRSTETVFASVAVPARRGLVRIPNDGMRESCETSISNHTSQADALNGRHDTSRERRI